MVTERGVYCTYPSNSRGRGRSMNCVAELQKPKVEAEEHNAKGRV